MSNFTHFDKDGNAVMVDVSQKTKTRRMAVATGKISMSAACYGEIKGGGIKKGDVLGTARLAGIMATKQTAVLIPLCHILPLEQASIDFVLDDEKCEIAAICTVKATDKTGVEMEAMMGASVALLTIYDMCKAVDKAMVIGGICLLEKQGGKSGAYKRGDGL
ncbi:MAG: cyclic pyranopterin monophosphate synthase MoaC [Defluviitaleaceae bacterium]|nr:cyclic pyranopterin monophosphate synthase MoaC [Defluviitaleaceae bacterium]